MSDQMTEDHRRDYATKKRLEDVLSVLDYFVTRDNAAGCSRPTWKALEATRAGLREDINRIVAVWE